MKPTLVVLAAGMGSRYGGIKQIEKVGPHGQSLIDYSIYNALKAGFGKIVLVVRKHIESQIKNFFANKIPANIQVQYVNQELENIPEEFLNNFSISEDREKPWGTGHAVWVCKDIVKEHFAMINGDDYYAYDALKKAVDFLNTVPSKSANYAVIGYKLKETLSEFGSVSRGICQVQNNLLTHLEEHAKIWREKDSKKIISDFNGIMLNLSGDEPVSMNIFAFTPAFISQLTEGFITFLKEKGQELKSEFYVPQYLGELVKTHKAQCSLLTTSAQWFGITYKEDTLKVRSILQELHDKGDYPNNLFA